MRKTTAKLYGVGAIPATVPTNNQQVTTKFYIVKAASTEAIMGLDVLSQLGFTIQLALGSVFAMEQEQPVMALPVIRGYQHKIVLKDDVTLIRHYLLEEISGELRSLQQEITEQVDISERISPVVVSHKENDKIRLCVDLRGPNSQLMLEMHPLPTKAELHTKLHEVVHLSCSDEDVLLLARMNARDTRLYLSITDILLCFCVSTQGIPGYIFTISILLCVWAKFI